MSKLRNVHEHGEEYQGVMPQLFQAAGSYGLHEGMRKEGSVSACPECVESVSLKRIIKPRGPPRRREKLWVYRARALGEAREPPPHQGVVQKSARPARRRAVSEGASRNHRRASQTSSYLQTCRSGGPGMVSLLAGRDPPGS